MLSNKLTWSMPAFISQNKNTECYTEDDLQEAVNKVKQGSSSRVACSTCIILKTTLKDRVNKMDIGAQAKPWGEDIVKKMELLSYWGFLFKKDNFKHFVKSYLDKKEVKTRFADNLSTRRFVDIFLGRHFELTFRKTMKSSVPVQPVQSGDDQVFWQIPKVCSGRFCRIYVQLWWDTSLRQSLKPKVSV